MQQGLNDDQLRSTYTPMLDIDFTILQITPNHPSNVKKQYLSVANNTQLHNAGDIHNKQEWTISHCLTWSTVFCFGDAVMPFYGCALS